MAVTKTIIKLSNTEAVIRISGVAGDTATIILDSDLLLPLEYLNNDPIQVNIGAVYCSGITGGYASLIRNNVTILNVANKSLNSVDLLGEPFVPDSINNTSNIVVTITGQQSQVYIYLKKVSGFTSTDSVIDSAFNVLSLFGAGEQGAWYDPSDLTTLFQNSAGTIPMSAVGTVADQPVGLMLDKSKGLALGAELVTNGTFTTDTGWTKGTGWTITGGQGVLTAGAGILQQAMGTVVVGTSYTVSINTNLAIQLRVGSANIGYFNPVNNTILCFITAIAGALIEIIPNGTQTGYVDNISVKQIAGNHAFQATAGNRPVLSARVNLLTKTEDFSATWINSGISLGALTVSPIGTLTGRTILGAATPGFSGNILMQILTTSTINKTFTFSIYLKAGTTSTCTIFSNLASGVERTYSVIPLTTEWKQYNIVCPFSVGSSDGNLYSHICPGNAVTGLDNGSVEIWGADLRPTNSGALLPPYQRVNTASDYDTVGFPLYLKANGTSSAMSTNSIDFSSTDKMTVVTGVRKLSDATRGIIGELSTAPASNPGSFILTAPEQSATDTYAFYTVAPSAMLIGLSGYSAPISNVITGLSSITPTSVTIRVNSLNTASVGGTGSGNFGNYPLYLFARAGTLYPLNGQFYGAIIRGETTDQTSVVKAEKLMATKTGITF